jgi:hypothetical protein
MKRKLPQEWLTIATERYLTQQESKHPKGVHTIIKEVKAECFRETNTTIHLSITTVLARARGRQSISEANSRNRWLTDTEEDTVVTYAINVAE